MDRPGPGPVGRAPRANLPERRGRRGVAGRGRRRGDRLRRGDGPGRHRRRRTGRAGGTWSGCAPNSAGSAGADASAGARRATARTRPPAASPARPAAQRARPGPGSARAGHHRQGGRPAVRPRRAGVVPAPPPARLPPRRPQPAAGHRVRRDRPGRDPPRGGAAGPALPVGGPVRPARRGVRSTPRQAQGRDGGPTSVKDCVLLCWFHHQVAIHRWGWTLVLNPDGTTTAWNKDKTKVLHSHGPPAGPGNRVGPPSTPRWIRRTPLPG